MVGLKSRAIAAARWTSLATFVQVSLQLLQIAIVARILPTEDFGLMAMVGAIMAFAAMLSGLGTANAILHFQSIDHERLSSLYWLNIALGLLISLTLAAASPLIAAWYGEPRLVPLVALTGLVFLLAAPGQQLRVQAQKDLRFGPLARVEVAAAAAAFCTTVGLALSGFGVYSLVGGVLTSRALGSVLDWAILADGWRPLRRLRLTEIRPFLGIGGYSIAANLANAMHSQADILLGGRLLNPSALGEFSVVRNLCLQTYAVVNPVVTRVVTPLMSIAQSDRARLQSIYLNVLRMTSSVNFPLYLALAFFADETVRILYGERWLASAALLEILAVWGMLRSIGNPTGSLIQATGRAGLAFRWEMAMSIAIPATLWLGLHWGTHGLVAAMLACSAALVFPIWFFLVLPLCGVRFADYAGQMIPPLWTALVAFSVARVMVGAIDATLPRLALGLTIGFTIYALLSLRFNWTWAAAVIALLRGQETLK